MSNADRGKQRERANKSKIVDEWRKADKQNKQMENSKEKTEDTQNLVIDSETETAYDLEEGGEKTRDDLIPKKETKGAEALKSTACDLKHEPAGEGESQLSILQPRATQGRETQQRAVRQNRGLEEAAATAADVPSVAPVHSSGVRSRCALEFPGGCAGSDHEDSAQAAAGHRDLGGPVERKRINHSLLTSTLPEQESRPNQPSH